MAPEPNSTVATVSHVVKRYGKQVALDDLTLGIEAGKVTALLGPNGAGKTTAIGVLLGLVAPNSGTVQVLGGPAGALPPRRRTGVMLQSAALPDTLKVGELLQLVRGYYPQPRPLAEIAALTGIAAQLSQPYARLSGGQQRRVQFALAICGNPQLLFLDEPTTGLKPGARESLWTLVRELTARGCAILLTTHYLEEAEALAQRVIVLVRGRIVSEGSVDEIRARGVRRHIRCISSLAVEDIRASPGVTNATPCAAVARDREHGGRARRAAPAGRRCVPERARSASHRPGRSIRPYHPRGSLKMYISMNSGALALTTVCRPHARLRGARLFAGGAQRIPAAAAHTVVLRADDRLPADVLPAVRHLSGSGARPPGRRARSARQLPGDRLHGARPVRARHHARQ